METTFKTAFQKIGVREIPLLFLWLGLFTLVPPVVAAPPANQSIINGLSDPTNASQRFFEQGREQFEQEIAWLTEKERMRSSNLLSISQEVFAPESLEPHEEIETLPNEVRSQEHVAPRIQQR